jgi:hypothetical protein
MHQNKLAYCAALPAFPAPLATPRAPTSPRYDCRLQFRDDIYPDRWPQGEPVIIWAHTILFIPVSFALAIPMTHKLRTMHQNKLAYCAALPAFPAPLATPRAPTSLAARRASHYMGAHHSLHPCLCRLLRSRGRYASQETLVLHI